MRLRRALALAALAALPLPALAGGGERFVLAWPPTRYESAELVLWRDVAGAAPLRVRVVGRGIDQVVDVPASAPARVPLPQQARCAPGVDACALEAVRVAGDDAFSAVLQSPDTNGAADTLLLTAHDTVRLPPARVAATRHVALSMPCPPAAEMPMSASFVTVVPAGDAARVTAPAHACLGATDVVLVAGEALTLACSAAGEDLSGLEIDADAPVIALSGNAVTTVPLDPGRGLSGDLVLDLAARADGPARFAVPPLPRSAALAGRGDVVRIVGVETARVRVLDDRGGRRDLALEPGEVMDLDTAADGGDLVLSIEADASIAAWLVPKSRALRGLGDPAAVPLVPSSRFTLRDRVFVPDGYAEANVLSIAASPGARVTLDGAPVALAPAPGGGLDVARVELPPPPPGGAVHELAADAPFGAWVACFGGYKASGHAAAIAWPEPAPEPWLRRGVRADALEPLVPAGARAHEDPEPGALLFWQVDDAAAVLRAARCGVATCLSW